MKNSDFHQFPLPDDLATRLDALYQWLDRKYGLKSTEVMIGEECYRVFSVADMDRVLAAVLGVGEKAGDRSPYWAELWPSAVALGEYLIEAADLQGKTTLELGCGVGLVGLIAHRMGGKVVLSDLEEDALRLAELNWLVNAGETPQTLLLDWRTPAPSQKFDVLLAADVAYEAALFSPLVNTLESLLAPGGSIYLAEPDRPVARPFFDLLREKHFRWEKSSRTSHLGETRSTVSVYRIRR